MALLHHLSEGQTSINQITVSPADGHSFPFNIVLTMKIFLQSCFYFFLPHFSLLIIFRWNPGVANILHIFYYLFVVLSLSCLLVGHALSPHQSDDQTKGGV